MPTVSGAFGFGQSGTCFAMMPFNEQFNDVYEKAIKPAVEADCGLVCERADWPLQPGVVADRISKSIDEATLCIADLTGENKNVVYEVALAHARGKTTFLVTQDDPSRLFFNIQHFLVEPYHATDEGYAELRKRLADGIRRALRSDDRVLRAMLVPPTLDLREDDRFVIAASPLSYRQAFGTRGGFKMLMPTSSDQVGIRGLIQAFGVMYGLHRQPELISPGDFVDEVANEAMNLYTIASPKANPWTRLLLREFHKQWTPRWAFKADPESHDLWNVRVDVHLDDHFYMPPGHGQKGDRWRWDFGLLIRGPHPLHQRCMLTVLAGRSSLGTEAACRAATDPEHIGKIGEHLALKGVGIEDYRRAFWAVVAMSRDEEHKPAADTLEICSAGPFKPLRQSTP